MTDPIGAPGTDMNRREFVKATGLAGGIAVAGCQAPAATVEGQGETEIDSTPQQTDAEVPTASPPEVVNVDERGGEVTISTVAARHDVHSGERMGGPVELPRVWAFQAADRDPSVPGPIIRTTEGNDIEVTLDNTDNDMPHTLHFHGVRKTWENDGVPTTTPIPRPSPSRRAC